MALTLVQPEVETVEDDDLESVRVEHADGSVEINLDAKMDDKGNVEKEDNDFESNLALRLDDASLAEIARQLLDGIDRDEQSRKDWLETRAHGIKLLGLKLEEPRGDLGTTSAPLEGQSTVRHPLLLEATIGFQANARGELLPAAGPVKIRNDTVSRPSQDPTISPLPGLGGGGLAPPGGPPPTPQPPPDGPTRTDELADALEMDMNHYLTAVATEYVPDTDRMLFYIGFGGDGFKKVYNCPLRRRPVSESVDAKDLIISDMATDIQTCTRVTHKSMQPRSWVGRMQLAGAFRDVPLGEPAMTSVPNPVTEVIAEIDGQKVSLKLPEDRPYEILECHCELELDQFAPKKFKGKGIPLPYRVTIEKDSRQVLAIYRRWEEKDEECLPEQFFVQFPFVRGLGFYGLGFIHILGNTTSALTAMWRLMVDAGMFANFPAFIYSKEAGRQLTNQFRASPGGGVSLQVPAGGKLQDMVMPMPYKEVGPSLNAFVQNIEDKAKRLAGTADIQVGEGKQEAPVGTTIALIEQANKMLDSVHKRLHWAQSQEFMLLKARFKKDPEAFFRGKGRPSGFPWKKDMFLQALENCDLVPVADPNNPTSMHRMLKAGMLEGMLTKYPLFLDTKAGLQRIFKIAGVDIEGILRDQPLPPPPDPKMEAIKAKNAAQAQQVAAQNADSMRRAQIQLMQLEDKADDRESRESIEDFKGKLQLLRLQMDAAMQQADADNQQAQTEAQVDATYMKTQAELEGNMRRLMMEMQGEQEKRAAKMRGDLMQVQADHGLRQVELRAAARESEIETRQYARDSEAEGQRKQSEHEAQLRRDDEAHARKMKREDELNQAKIAQAKALAKIQKSAKPKPAAKK